ncbi:hypothetical protein OED52_01290 [Rhodococcus sp. Z13]|uniref:Uncharacterized protein n=1 Tax=Rhodococcus sacchari TaxID=2962047 RepID=A0ACD4DGN3_9NOCA|nr:hypothetical protein [Rhodococcus sp. Z13]UYP19245.1 hypothetical protein OED52_01290 [Rhodococcus sp. Z13]
MTTGGSDPNQDPKNPGGYPPPGNYPPPSGGSYPPPSGGSYPPPGNYPPPQSGGYTPPPSGGSYPPPPGNYPPPPGAYGASGAYGAGGYGPAPTSRLSVGDALSYGWAKFSGNAGVWILFMVAAFIIQALISGIFNGFDFTPDDNGFSASFSATNAIGTVVTTIVGYLIQAAFVRGALAETDGQKPAFGTFLQIGPIGAVIVAGLLVGIGTTIGLFLCIIPGLAFAFLTWWTMQFVIDRNQDAVTAIKSSFNAIKSNAGTLLLLALALLGINLVGALLCGLGLLVSVPVSIIAVTYAYRVTTGGPVAP